MANKSSGRRAIPALAVLLLIIIAAAAWLVLQLQTAPDAGPAGADSRIPAQTAILQARRALSGDEAAWNALQTARSQLQSVSVASTTSADNDRLAQVESNVTVILESKADIQAFQKTLVRLGELTQGFSVGVATLQIEPDIQNESQFAGHLSALGLYAETIGLLALQLPEGDSQQKQMLVSNEQKLQQAVLLTKSQLSEDTYMTLSRRASQIGAGVRESLALLDQTAAAFAALRKLEALPVQAADRSAVSVAGPVSIEGLLADQQLMQVFAVLGAGCLLVLILLMVWWRGSGSRSETARLTQQSENDQQAILQLLDELDSLADGDLTVQATVNESVTGAIADSVNYAIEALRDLVTTIKDGSILLEDATRKTEVSARALESASEEQARQVKDASGAVGQMAASIDEVSGNAERSADVARHSVDIAHKGGDAVRRTIEGMNTIRETIQDTSKRIKRLGESTQEIGDIVELINDIADQTNILALNASIQASMAGEAGRGFAVVADEVQRLAERSASATKQIEVLVSTIQSDTNEAVVSMERSTTDVVGGALLAENAGAALEEIEQVSNQIAMLVQNISGSAKDQAEVAKAVLLNVEHLQEISGKTDASAATTAKYISKMSTLASQLKESAAGFVLPGKQGASAASGASGKTSAAAPNRKSGVLAGESAV